MYPPSSALAGIDRVFSHAAQLAPHRSAQAWRRAPLHERGCPAGLIPPGPRRLRAIWFMRFRKQSAEPRRCRLARRIVHAHARNMCREISVFGKNWGGFTSWKCFDTCDLCWRSCRGGGWQATSHVEFRTRDGPQQRSGCVRQRNGSVTAPIVNADRSRQIAAVLTKAHSPTRYRDMISSPDGSSAVWDGGSVTVIGADDAGILGASYVDKQCNRKVECGICR